MAQSSQEDDVEEAPVPDDDEPPVVEGGVCKPFDPPSVVALPGGPGGGEGGPVGGLFVGLDSVFGVGVVFGGKFVGGEPTEGGAGGGEPPELGGGGGFTAGRSMGPEGNPVDGGGRGNSLGGNRVTGLC